MGTPTSFKQEKLFLTCESCKRFCRVKAERKISALFVGKEGVRDLEIPGDILTITDDKSDEEIMQEILTGKHRYPRWNCVIYE